MNAPNLESLKLILQNAKDALFVRKYAHPRRFPEQLKTRMQ
jgi:hypothetical protein